MKITSSPRRKRRASPEAAMQEQFFAWLRSKPKVDCVTWHTPNGGKRDLLTARKFMRLGVKPGVPDVFCAIPNGPFHGLFIEFKDGYNGLTKNQEKITFELLHRDYKVALCYSCEDAKRELKEYLQGSEYDINLTTQRVHNQASIKRATNMVL